MADGLLCKNCGYQETEHSDSSFVESPEKKLRGRKYSLNSCPGFTLSSRDKKTERKLRRMEEKEAKNEGERLINKNLAAGEVLETFFG